MAIIYITRIEVSQISRSEIGSLNPILPIIAWTLLISIVGICYFAILMIRILIEPN